MMHAHRYHMAHGTGSIAQKTYTAFGLGKRSASVTKPGARVVGSRSAVATATWRWRQCVQGVFPHVWYTPTPTARANRQQHTARHLHAKVSKKQVNKRVSDLTHSWCTSSKMMSSRDLVEKRNVHLEGKEHRQERRRWTSTFICLQKCPDVVKVLKDNSLRPSK